MAHLDRVHLPNRLTLRQILLSIVLPGFAFFTNGRRVLGWSFVAAYWLAAMVFLIVLGYRFGSLAYGVMIGAHATSIIFLEGHWLRARSQFRMRLVLASLTLLVVWLGMYAPMVRFVQNHFFMPLRVRNYVVVVRRSAVPGNLARGDVAAFKLDEETAGDGHHGGAVQVREGYGCGAVLALGGDRVEFSTNSFAVNGAARKRLPHMPTEGSFVVPEKHWFVWPEFDITMRGNVGEAAISSTMMQLAVVPQDRFAGTAFRRWFGRRQNLL